VVGCASVWLVLKNVANVNQSANHKRESNDPLNVPFRNFLQCQIVISAYGHVPVDVDENVADVCGHFESRAQISHEYYFVQLSDVGGSDRGTKVASQGIHTAIDGIKNKNDAVQTVKNGIKTHVGVKTVFQIILLVLVDGSND
jgi:hypothetical protein